MTRVAGVAAHGGGATQPAWVEQGFFHVAPDGAIAVLASSLTDPLTETGWTELLENHLPATSVPGVPAFTYVTLPGGYAALLRRLRRYSGDVHVHGLLGLPAQLTPDFALRATGWPGWLDSPPTDTALPHVDPADVPVPGAERALRDQALRQAEPLAVALAWLLQSPRTPIGFVGCPDDDRIPLLWALRDIAGHQQAAWSISQRTWTFSTHGDPAPQAPPADVTFLEATDDPRLHTGRVVVAVDGAQSASPQRVKEAFAMLYRLEYGVDPAEPSGLTVPAAVPTAPAAPPTSPASGPAYPQTPATGFAGVPAPAGRYAELVRDLVTARNGVQVRNALEQLEYAVTGLDRREELRAELESAGWGLAVIERHVPAGGRERDYDRLVQVAFGASAPGRETQAARADARRLTMAAESDAFVRALVRAAEGNNLAPEVEQRWMRQSMPAKPDPRDGLGPLGRFLHDRGRPVTPERERLLLWVAVLIAFALTYLLGVVSGIAAA